MTNGAGAAGRSHAKAQTWTRSRRRTQNTSSKYSTGLGVNLKTAKRLEENAGENPCGLELGEDSSAEQRKPSPEELINWS